LFEKSFLEVINNNKEICHRLGIIRLLKYLYGSSVGDDVANDVDI